MTYGNFKDYLEEQLLKNYCVIKHLMSLSIADSYQRGITSMLYKFFDKKVAGGAAQSRIISNQDLPEELYKPIIRKVVK